MRSDRGAARGSGSIVSVGPPLSCSGPRIGSALVPGQVVPPQVRLPPWSKKFEAKPALAQFESDTSPLLATIVFFRYTLAPEVS